MIAVLLLAVGVAQDTARPPRLVLADVYREARSASPRAAAARSLADAARARVAPAKLPPDPQLQFGFMNYAIPGLAPMDQIGMAQFQLMQMIPTAGKLGLSGRVAAAQADAVSARADDVVWDVRANAAMAFYDLYATDGALDVARQTLRLLQDILRTAESMYRVGEGRQTDVLRAQVEIARMTEDTVRMTTMRTGMAAQLNALLNRAADAPVGSPDLPAFPDSVSALGTFLQASQSDRPMVKAGEREVDAATAQVTLTRREIWPDLTIGLQYGQRGDAMGATDRMGSLMIGASVPVFANRRQLRMRQEAGAMRLMAEADLAAMRADTRASVTEAYANLMRSRHLAALYRTTIIPQADATTASALAAYRVGGVDFMTLLDDRMTVNKYRQDLYSLEADEGKAWSELEMLLGRELFAPANIAARAIPPRHERDQED
jgi:outer membrane protein TolC